MVSRPAQVAQGPVERATPLREKAAGGDRIGIVPILWNNADLPDLAPPVPALTVLDEIARLGYSGTQLGIGFPRGRALAAELASRGLRLAEVYVALPGDASGPAPAAAEVARAGIEELESFWRADRAFNPNMSDSERQQLFDGWRAAVARARL